jgi:hypothetical protein
MLNLKLLEKLEQAKPKIRRRGEIIKLWPKIIEIKTKNPYKESTKQKAGCLKR